MTDWIARPSTAMAEPIWKAPVEIAVGTPLGVRDGEVVVLAQWGRPAALLHAGGHVLSPADHPFLHNSPGPYDAFFVATEDCGWITLGGRGGAVVDPGTGLRVGLTVRGTYAVDLGDPWKIVSELLSQGDPPAVLRDWLAQHILAAAKRAIAETVAGGAAVGTLREPETVGRLADAIAAAAREAAPEWIEGLRFSELVVEADEESRPALAAAAGNASATRGEPAAATPPPGAKTLAVGDRVQVLWTDGGVHRATIAAFADGRYEVMWDGAGATAWVPPTHVRYFPDPAWRPEPGDYVDVRRDDGWYYPAMLGNEEQGWFGLFWNDATLPAARVDRSYLRPIAGESFADRMAQEALGKPAARTWAAQSRVTVRARDGQERPATITMSAGLRYLVSYDDVRRREWVEPEQVLAAREASAAASAGFFAADLAASLFLSPDAAREVGSHLDFTVPPTGRGGPFREFERVWAQAEDRRWYGAKIKKKTGTASFLVEWEDEGMGTTYLDARYLRGL